jgi:hypothetical protein
VAGRPGHGLTELFRRLLRGLWQDLLAIDVRVTELDREITLVAQNDPVAVRLHQLRGPCCSLSNWSFGTLVLLGQSCRQFTPRPRWTAERADLCNKAGL